MRFAHAASYVTTLCSLIAAAALHAACPTGPHPPPYAGYNGYCRLEGDTNGDGSTDLVFVGDTAVFTLRNGDPNELHRLVSLQYGSQAYLGYEPSLADRNDDNVLDLVMTGKAVVFVFRGRGDGTFAGTPEGGPICALRPGREVYPRLVSGLAEVWGPDGDALMHGDFWVLQVPPRYQIGLYFPQYVAGPPRFENAVVVYSNMQTRQIAGTIHSWDVPTSWGYHNTTNQMAYLGLASWYKGDAKRAPAYNPLAPPPPFNPLEPMTSSNKVSPALWWQSAVRQFPDGRIGVNDGGADQDYDDMVFTIGCAPLPVP